MSVRKKSAETLITVAVCAGVVVVVAGGLLYASGDLRFSSLLGLGDKSENAATTTERDEEIDSHKNGTTLPGFLEKRKAELITNGAQFIAIDLSDMSLEVYNDGEVTRTMPVKAISTETTWWRTAPGHYSVTAKIPSHKSSFGPVIMPWNIPFQGNFFIHGWPEYISSGKPAVSAVSAGCIRLAKADAKVLYDTIPYGTPILIFEDIYDSSLTYDLLADEIESVGAKSALAVNLSENEIAYAKNEETTLPVGAVGSLFSAVTASEYIGMETSMYASASFDDSGKIDEGKRYRLFDLLYPLLQDWSREPEAALTHYMGEERFLENLEYKARALGMDNSSVSIAENDTVALETTALDLVNLSRYLHIYRDFIFNISASEDIVYLYGAPSTGRRPYPRMLPGFENFKGGAYDEETGSALAVFEFNKEDGSVESFVFTALHSDDPLQDILDMRALVLEE